MVFLTHHIAAIDGDRLAGDIAGRVAAKPEDGIRNLLGSAQSLHRDESFQHLVQLFSLTRGDHLVRHGRLNHAGADIIDPNATCRVFQGRTLRKPDHAVLRGMYVPRWFPPIRPPSEEQFTI